MLNSTEDKPLVKVQETPEEGSVAKNEIVHLDEDSQVPHDASHELPGLLEDPLLSNGASSSDISGPGLPNSSIKLRYKKKRPIENCTFSCPHCYNAFSTSYALMSHIKKKHSVELPFSCAHCTYAFSDSHSLKNHIKARHIVSTCPDVTEIPEKFDNLLPSVPSYNPSSPCSSANTSLIKTQENGEHSSPGTKITGKLNTPILCSGASSKDFSSPESFEDSSIRSSSNKARKKGNRSFPCSHCKYSVTSRYKLMMHTKARHPGKLPFSCAHCHHAFSDPLGLKNHISLKHIIKQLSCSEVTEISEKLNDPLSNSGVSCYDSFTNGSSINLKTLQIEESSSFSSEILEELDDPLSSNGITSHDNSTSMSPEIHLPPKDSTAKRELFVESLSCNVCGYTSSSSFSFKRHFQFKHPGKDPFSCPDCDYTSSNLNAFKMHIHGHEGRELYICPHCDYSCIAPSTFQHHFDLKHPGKNPFSCPLCNFCCVQYHALKVHIKKIHQRLACSLCQFTCEKPSQLEKHSQTKHPNENPLSCPHCTFVCFHPSVLKSHIRMKHPKESPFSCPHCDAAFPKSSVLVKHIRSKHTLERRRFPCDHCSQTFYSLKGMNKHLKNIHLEVHKKTAKPLEKVPKPLKKVPKPQEKVLKLRFIVRQQITIPIDPPPLIPISIPPLTPIGMPNRSNNINWPPV